jgi:hypothetical protein
MLKKINMLCTQFFLKKTLSFPNILALISFIEKDKSN